DSRARLAQLRLARPCILQRDFIVEARETRIDHRVVMGSEIKQYRSLEPFVDRPDAVLGFRNTHRAGIEQRDRFLQHALEPRWNVRGRDFAAKLEGSVDGGFEILEIIVHEGFRRRNSRMRSAASMHCASGGTSEMRTRPAPGLPPAGPR